RFVDDAKVGDHHALIPTSAVPRALPPGSAEARIYDLVCRRLLMAWHDDMVEAVTRVVTAVGGPAHSQPDLFATQGIALEQAGWSVLERTRTADPNAKPKLPPGIRVDDAPGVQAVTVHRKQTQPPKPHTEATLLGAMETAGRQLEDRALIEAMRESGLGTPATRAATIETLLTRGYISRQAKSLISTPLGRALVDAVHPLVRSPEMTGRWEQRLRRMERGQDQLAAFMQDIAGYVREVVAAEAEKPAAPRQRRPGGMPRTAAKRKGGWKRKPRKTSAAKKRRSPD
ncbi:MAG TPA: DNA topoisomerase, partial [Polyangiales bacterium]|nr:DNA topoisomerase [Polyangiales bacterium]